MNPQKVWQIQDSIRVEGCFLFIHPEVKQIVKEIEKTVATCQVFSTVCALASFSFGDRNI